MKKNGEVINYVHSTFREEMLADVRKGLTSPQKYLPTKYLYDAYGSWLFEQICLLPEYYLTRTETGILRTAAPLIMDSLRECDIVELGSGSCDKICIFMDAVDGSRLPEFRYLPVDVSATAVDSSAIQMAEKYPGLKPLGLVADFLQHLEMIPADRTKLIMLLGSTLGNLAQDECLSFLKRVSGIMEHTDRFVVGIDLIKETWIMNAAYNDSRRVTAEFNRNILRVINRELGTSFIPEHFSHTAFFNEESEQVEIYLTADRDMKISLPEPRTPMEIRHDERILTEISRKFSKESAGELLGDAGMRILNWFSDPRGWFAVVELELL